jgi:hypothetical protein
MFFMKFHTNHNRSVGWAVFAALALVAESYGAESVDGAAKGEGAVASSSNQPVPRTPLLARAPTRSEWTVRMSKVGAEIDADDQRAQESGLAMAPGELRMLRSLKVSKDMLAKTLNLRSRWSDGESEDEWIVAGQHVADRPGGRGLYIVGQEDSTAQGMRDSDFPELNWLDMSYYRGMKPYKDEKVFVFSVAFDNKPLSGQEAQLFFLAKQADPSMTASKYFKPKVSEVEVYLDAVTQLPVFYNDGTTQREYRFSATPQYRLIPPADIVKFLKTRSDTLMRKLATPPGP